MSQRRKLLNRSDPVFIFMRTKEYELVPAIISKLHDDKVTVLNLELRVEHEVDRDKVITLEDMMELQKK